MLECTNYLTKKKQVDKLINHSEKMDWTKVKKNKEMCIEKACVCEGVTIYFNFRASFVSLSTDVTFLFPLKWFLCY